MLELTNDYLRRAGPGNRKCAICGEEVREPDDYLMIGYLFDPASDPLSSFNYTHLHKSHIRQWNLAGDFLAFANTTLSRGNWRGPALAEIVREIETRLIAPD